MLFSIYELLFKKKKSKLDNQSRYLFQWGVTGQSHCAVALLYYVLDVMLFLYVFKVFCFFHTTLKFACILVEKC